MISHNYCLDLPRLAQTSSQQPLNQDFPLPPTCLDLPRLAQTCLDLPRPALNSLYIRISRCRRLAQTCLDLPILLRIICLGSTRRYHKPKIAKVSTMHWFLKGNQWKNQARIKKIIENPVTTTTTRFWAPSLYSRQGQKNKEKCMALEGERGATVGVAQQ